MNPAVPARSTPQGDPSNVATLVFRTEPGEVLVSLSVQAEARGSRGVVRGDGPAYVIGERNGRGVRVTTPEHQRAGFLPVLADGDSHLARFEDQRPDRLPVAVTGCGNLLCNRGVLARNSAGRFGIAGPMRAGVRVRGGSKGDLLEGDALAAALAPTSVFDEDDFVVTGPLLVRNGIPLPPDADEYADLRHLVLPAWVELASGLKVDFALDRMMSNRELRYRAVQGEPVRLALIENLPVNNLLDASTLMYRISPERLRPALIQKGYRETIVVDEPGTFAIDDRAITIAFLPGIYPHHALAVDEDGSVASVVVTGRSNREGTTIRDLALALAAGGAKEAILLDNGGDVGLLRRESPGESWDFVARPAEDDRSATWPLRACLIYHRSRLGV